MVLSVSLLSSLPEGIQQNRKRNLSCIHPCDLVRVGLIYHFLNNKSTLKPSYLKHLPGRKIKGNVLVIIHTCMLMSFQYFRPPANFSFDILYLPYILTIFVQLMIIFIFAVIMLSSMFSISNK